MVQKSFSDVYLVKFLDILAKLCGICICDC